MLVARDFFQIIRSSALGCPGIGTKGSVPRNALASSIERDPRSAPVFRLRSRLVVPNLANFLERFFAGVNQGCLNVTAVANVGVGVHPPVTRICLTPRINLQY
jgi:hypothetical protein